MYAYSAVTIGAAAITTAIVNTNRRSELWVASQGARQARPARNEAQSIARASAPRPQFIICSDSDPPRAIPCGLVTALCCVDATCYGAATTSGASTAVM